jgi:SAM-dependent methyltransferase
MNEASLADIIRRREIRKICYFHTDHFEPWSKGINADTALGVQEFAKKSKTSRFAERSSLFYHTFLPYRLDHEIAALKTPGLDAIVFERRSAADNDIVHQVMAPLEMEGQHEIHIHIHHESFTRNTGEYGGQLSRWVNAHSSAELDSLRLQKAIVLTKRLIAADIGRPIDRWAFVHGNWALNASDPSICWIEDEIALLMRHGCFGDFTFPAGRGHCDPKSILEPYTCIPLSQPKGYDLPAAVPKRISEGAPPLEAGRFFIWNSPIKADYSSLDYYSDANRERFKEPEACVKAWLERSVSIDRTLFIKTHAHSLKWEYEIQRGANPIPHLYPPVIRLFELLERVCERAGVELEVMTVNSVMSQLQQLMEERRNANVSTIHGMYGEIRKTSCPVCGSSSIRNQWRIPMTSINPPATLFGGYFNQVPTLKSPFTIYAFDACEDCESIFLNPDIPRERQIESYRRSSHYIKKMEDQNEWRGYAERYEMMRKFVPTGASAIIDAASGLGQIATLARQDRSHAWQRVVALELSSAYVENMRSQGIEAYELDIDNDALEARLDAAAFDFVVFFEAFEHVMWPTKALEKLLRTLRPGGRLFFSAQRYGPDVNAAVRPGEPIYIGQKYLELIETFLPCKVIDVAPTGTRYFIVIEKIGFRPANATPDDFTIELRLDSGFRKELGHCWTAKLATLDSSLAPQLQLISDREGQENASPLRLFEVTEAGDERELGPAHSMHATIRSTGGGCFSHWKDTLYFSTSDNTDPNSNDRKYLLRVTL